MSDEEKIVNEETSNVEIETEKAENKDKVSNESKDVKKDKGISKDMITILITILALVVVTGIAAWWYLNNRNDVPEHSLAVVVDGEEETVDIDGLTLSGFSGTVVNGKGDKKDIDAEGVKLSDLIDTDEYAEITITSDDAYSVVVRKDEVDNAYLEIEDGTARLYVFGDENSKRNVKNVVRIEVE